MNGWQLKVILLVALLALPFLSGKAVASSPASMEVGYTLVFGPAPVGLMDSQGRYMWVMSEVKNNTGVAKQANVALQVTGAPNGCWQIQQLVLPGDVPFELAAGQTRWVL